MTMTENTSGAGDAAYVPPQIQGWNWGAFLLNWVWALFNLSGGKAALSILIMFFVPLGNIVWAIMLGVKGNEWAWREKRWQNLEHFRTVQRKWTVAGVIVLAASIVLGVLSAIFVLVIVAANS